MYLLAPPTSLLIEIEKELKLYIHVHIYVLMVILLYTYRHIPSFNRVFYQLILRNLKEQNDKKKTSRGGPGAAQNTLYIPIVKYDVETFRSLIEFIHCGTVKIGINTVAGDYLYFIVSCLRALHQIIFLIFISNFTIEMVHISTNLTMSVCSVLCAIIHASAHL